MTHPQQARYTLASKARLVMDQTRGQATLLYPERGLVLNDVAHAIALACESGTTLATLLDDLQQRFPDTDAARLERDTRAFLAELRTRGLLVEQR